MRRHLLLTCVSLSLVALAPPAAAADRYSIRFPGMGPLGVTGGKVRVVFPNPEEYDWELTLDEGEPGTIRVLRPEKWRGWYLAYDPEGKDRAAFLAEEQGPGTRWVLTRVKGDRLSAYTIRAAAGKPRGWYLDVEAKGKEFSNQKGETSTAYRVFLSGKPRRLPKAFITVVGP